MHGFRSLFLDAGFAAPLVLHEVQHYRLIDIQMMVGEKHKFYRVNVVKGNKCKMNHSFALHKRQVKARIVSG